MTPLVAAIGPIFSALAPVVQGLSLITGLVSGVSSLFSEAPRVPDFSPQVNALRNDLSFSNSLQNEDESVLQQIANDPNRSQFDRNAAANELRFRQSNEEFGRAFQEKLDADDVLNQRVNTAVSEFEQATNPDVLDATIGLRKQARADADIAKLREGLQSQRVQLEQDALKRGLGGSTRFLEDRSAFERDAQLAELQVEKNAEDIARAFTRDALSAQSNAVSAIRAGASDEEARNQFNLALAKSERDFERQIQQARTLDEIAFAERALRFQQEAAFEQFRRDAEFAQAKATQGLTLLGNSIGGIGDDTFSFGQDDLLKEQAKKGELQGPFLGYTPFGGTDPKPKPKTNHSTARRGFAPAL